MQNQVIYGTCGVHSCLNMWCTFIPLMVSNTDWTWKSNTNGLRQSRRNKRQAKSKYRKFTYSKTDLKGRMSYLFLLLWCFVIAVQQRPVGPKKTHREEKKKSHIIRIIMVPKSSAAQDYTGAIVRDTRYDRTCELTMHEYFFDVYCFLFYGKIMSDI